MRLTPDLILDSFDALTVDFLKQKDIRFLILDIDNTLIPYEETEPHEAVRAWLMRLKEANISVSFVTNNHKPRLEAFNATLGYPAFANSAKPFRRNMKKAMRAMGADAKHTANMGDQIFTDVWAGRRMRLYTVLVPPIKDKRDPFTRFKRLLERPIKRAYYKKKEESK
ncbi:MAG: YqeG family HAD IIIA-type phosphatase [Ruminococcaceae bacterium]|nr:YqeG family HAD IIIA-type phosphatase [Oscillospiraceae bacterium]